MKITVNKVVYDVVKEKEINGNCIGCFLKGVGYVNCLKITNIDCIVEKVIFLKVPDSLNNCEYEVISATSWKTYHDLGYDRKEQKQKSIELAISIVRNADIDDNIADAILIGIFASKKLRSD